MARVRGGIFLNKLNPVKRAIQLVEDWEARGACCMRHTKDKSCAGEHGGCMRLNTNRCYQNRIQTDFNFYVEYEHLQFDVPARPRSAHLPSLAQRALTRQFTHSPCPFGSLLSTRHVRSYPNRLPLHVRRRLNQSRYFHRILGSQFWHRHRVQMPSREQQEQINWRRRRLQAVRDIP